MARHRARSLLLDTGVIVALVNAADPDHHRCVDVWRTLRGRFVSVEGVMVEASHLLRRVPGASSKAAALVAAVSTRFVPLTQERLDRAVALMAKYHELPMDLVDALLVVAAEDEGIDEVLTLDRRGFDVYRLHGRKPFRVLPAVA